MKGIKEFEVYLKEWCEKNNKPCPKIDHINEIWQKAWDSFVKEELKPEWQERKQEYLDMKLMRVGEVSEQQEEISEEKSEWDKVKEMLQ